MILEAAIKVSVSKDSLEFNTREVTISFLEECGSVLSKYLVKKHPAYIEQIVRAGF